MGVCITLKSDVSQKHNVYPVLYSIAMSPNSKGRLEITAEAVARSHSIKSAVLKDLKQSKVREGKGKRAQGCGRKSGKPNEGISNVKAERSAQKQWGGGDGVTGMKVNSANSYCCNRRLQLFFLFLFPSDFIFPGSFPAPKFLHALEFKSTS